MTLSELQPLPLVRLTSAPSRLDVRAKLYLLPRGLTHGLEAAEDVAAGRSRPLAGTATAFSRLHVFARYADRIEDWDMAGSSLPAWLSELSQSHRERASSLLGALTRKRRPFAGLDLNAPRLMGIVNATPDSFSDGGEAFGGRAAFAAVKALAAEGADIVDVGAESTRPGAELLSLGEEMARLTQLFVCIDRMPDAERPLLSIDTRKAAVMRAALSSHFAIVNDVSALEDDPASLETVVDGGAHVVVMHRQGMPATMNVAPSYAHVLLDVFDALDARIAVCERAGIPRNRIAIDPGIGFGKRGAQNQELLRGLAMFHGLGCPLLVGLSRKSFSLEMERRYAPAARMPGTLAALVLAMERGAQILRVHDVAATKQALEVFSTIGGGEVGEKIAAICD